MTTDQLGGFIGRIGTDRRGVKFLVLAPGNVKGPKPDDGSAYVAIIDAAKSGLIPGSILHSSWLDDPIAIE